MLHIFGIRLLILNEMAIERLYYLISILVHQVFLEEEARIASY